jgi:phospholipid N-methyltransferase
MDSRGFVDRRKKGFERQMLVLKALARNPRDMGTLFPSSHYLAGAMAGAVSPRMTKNGVFVELGAGTGPVTEALLKRGIPPERLIVIEKSPALAECLHERFPHVDVRCCGAEVMGACLPEKARVSAIISSLPFRSLPREVSISIMREVERTLSSGGIFVQFTYALVGKMPFIPAEFRKVRTRLVPFNVPPARVEVYLKPRDKGVIVV